MRKKQPRVIGSAVRSYRARLGMTQSEVAELADVAPETLSRIERNRISASLDLTRRLAESLQVSVDELLQPRRRVTPRSTRPAEARLLNAVRHLDDAQIDDVTRALKTLMALGRELPKEIGGPREPSKGATEPRKGGNG